MSEANFKKNFWIPAIKAKIGKFIEFNKDKESYTREEIERDLTTVRQELAKQNLEGLPIEFDNPERFTIDNLNQDLTDELSTYLATINKLYIRQYNANSDAKDQMIRDLQSDEKSKKAFNTLRNDYENESLSDLVTNKNEFNQVTEYDGKLIQRADPVFNIPDGFRSHFYAPSKQVFGKSVSTKNVNVMVLWLMCIMLAITLYFDGFKKLLDLFSNIQIGKN
jgi:ABC transport system ATP-binding/permease protein